MAIIPKRFNCNVVVFVLVVIVVVAIVTLSSYSSVNPKGKFFFYIVVTIHTRQDIQCLTYAGFSRQTPNFVGEKLKTRIKSLHHYRVAFFLA